MKQSKGPAYEALQPKRWRYLRELGELRLAYNAKPLHLRYWSSLADGCGESNGARADANLILTMHARFPLLLDIAEKALRVQLVGDSFGRDDLCDSMSRLYGGRGHSWMPWEPPSEGPDDCLIRVRYCMQCKERQTKAVPHEQDGAS